MTNITQTPAYRVAFSMYVALGGDKTMIFDSVDAIYAEIDKFYGKGSRITTEALTLEITENKAELYNDDVITGYKPVSISVNVPQKYTDEQVEDLKETSRQQGYDSGYDKGIADGYVQGETAGYTDGYAEGLEDGAEDQKALLEEITIKDNGVYEKEDGYKKVTVEVPIPEIPTFETEELSVEITDNGTYNYTPTADGYSKVSVTVEVAGSGGGGGFDWSSSSLTPEEISVIETDINNGISHSENFSSLMSKRGSSSSKASAFAYDGNLLYIPNYSFTSGVTNISSCFNYCINLKYVGNFTGTYVTNVQRLFYNCYALKKVKHLNFRNATTFANMFENCNGLEEVEQITVDTGKITSTQKMFKMQSNAASNFPSQLKTAPMFDTSAATDMSEMFSYCQSLENVPAYNTSKSTTFYNTFSYCKKLKFGPELDTSSATKMNYMFADCSLLTTVPAYNTSKVTTFSNMFQGCYNLTSLPEFDCSAITNPNMFSGGGSQNFTLLTDIGGFKDLGKASSLSVGSDFLQYCPSLTHTSVMNIVNKLYDRASAGYSVLTLKFNKNVLALLSDEEKAIATTKGWTLTT